MRTRRRIIARIVLWSVIRKCDAEQNHQSSPPPQPPPQPTPPSYTLYEGDSYYDTNNSNGNEEHTYYPLSSAGVPLPSDWRRRLDNQQHHDDDSNHAADFSNDQNGLFVDFDNDDNNVHSLFEQPGDNENSPQQQRQQSYYNSNHAVTSQQQQQQQQHIPPLRTPIVYRYYGRQKTRDAKSGSIPFILIGPNVDHWKVTGQILSARGFNVIAVGPKDEHIGRHEGPGLVLQLMDALRWNRAVVVGSDRDIPLAIQAAMQLSPNRRIAGLIVCGQFDETEQLIRRTTTTSSTATTTTSSTTNPYLLDQYLHERLHCPFTIVWDGNTPHQRPAASSSSTSLSLHPYPNTYEEPASAGASAEAHQHRHRTIIIGGGTAPHRRRPEIFAWVLTRFVEEHLAPKTDVSTHSGGARIQPQERPPSSTNSWRYPELPWKNVMLDDMFTEESMVVFGRVVATALLYGVALKIVLYQYENFRLGVDVVAHIKRSIVQGIQRKISQIVYCIVFVQRIPSFLFRTNRKKSRKEKDDDLSDDDEDALLAVGGNLDNRKENDGEEINELDGGERGEQMKSADTPSTRDGVTTEDEDDEAADNEVGDVDDQQDQDEDADQDFDEEDDDESLEEEDAPPRNRPPLFFLDHVLA